MLRSFRLPLALFLAAALVPAYAGAAPPKKEEKTPPAKQAAADKDPPTTKDPIKLVPEGLKWGMPRADLEALVDKFIDEDYKPKFKRQSPGVGMKNLEAEVTDKKAS